MFSIRRAAAVLPAAALAVFTLAGTAAASDGNGSGPGTVTAVTHVFAHPDTTSAGGSCTTPIAVPGGPVWAYDNLSLRLVATQTGSDTYDVVITAHGSFMPVCDPITGGAYTGSNAQGSVDGTYDLTVTSPSPPDPANLPAQSDGPTVTQSGLVRLFFGGSASSVVGGAYNYTYNPVNGQVYTQSG